MRKPPSRLRVDKERCAVVARARRKLILANTEANAAQAELNLAIARALGSVNRSAEDSLLCLGCTCVVPRPPPGQPAEKCDCPQPPAPPVPGA